MTHIRRSRILSQPARQRTVPEAPWEYGFAQFLGRKLTPAEIAVIRPIEKARKKWQARPFLVIDPPGADSTALLRKYQEYCLSLCEETYGILVHPAGERPRNRSRQVFLTSPRNAEATRGMTSRFTLLLHVERYRTVSPFSGSRYNYRWRDLWCALLPQLTEDGVLIVHTAMPEGLSERQWHRRLAKIYYISPPADFSNLPNLPEDPDNLRVPIVVLLTDPAKAEAPPDPPPSSCGARPR